MAETGDESVAAVAEMEVLNTHRDPSWFTPRRLLSLFCVINMINYIDRGAIASNGVNGSRGTCKDGGTCYGGSGIQGDFHLSNFQDGLLSSAFMVGLIVASPIFAAFSKTHNPFRLIGVGLSVWTVAVAGCGLSFNFWSIMLARMLVGVGEASFISLASPFIDDHAPPEKKTAWLSVFYMCIPTGIAIGYVYGGIVGSLLSWRVAFWIEAILMLPFAIFGFVTKPLSLKGLGPLKNFSDSGIISDEDNDGIRLLNERNVTTASEFIPAYSENNETKRPGKIGKAFHQLNILLHDLKILILNGIYLTNVLGYIAYNFVIGAYSYWGPKAGYSIYNMKDADIVFGALTVICGIFGTIAGGYVLDYIGSTLSNAFKLLSGVTLVGGLFCFCAFLSKSLYGFIPLFGIGELLVFATQGPVNYVALRAVVPSLRPLAMAMCTVSIHVFGDVPSSPLVGTLQDHVNNWRATALILTSIFFLSGAIWFIGIFLKAVDNIEEEEDIPDGHYRSPSSDAASNI